MPQLPLAEELADALNRIGGYKNRTPKKSGGFMARCPNHNDRTPSLLISNRPDGSLHFHCFACASTREVVEAVESAMGYEHGTLRRPRQDTPRPSPRQAAKRPAKQKYTPVIPVPDTAPLFDHANPAFAQRSAGAPVASWAYTTAEGGLIGYVARYEQTDDEGNVSKSVYPWIYGERNGARRWTMQSFPTPRPLYNLQKIVEEPDAVVQIHEGEKAADAAQKLIPEWIATTPPGGGQAVHLCDLEPLRGRKVVICPDNDSPGTEFAIKLAGLLQGIADDIRIMRLPTFRVDTDAPTMLKPFVPNIGDDAADYIEAGWTYNELRTVLQLSDIPLTWPVAS